MKNFYKVPAMFNHVMAAFLTPPSMHKGMLCQVCYCALFMLLWALNAWGQERIPVGTWRTHYAYFQGKHVAVSSDAAFCATDNGLFRYRFSDGTLSVLSNANVLSDVGVSALAFSATTQTLVVGYANGNIDLLKPDGTVNIRTVLNSAFNGKAIAHIQISGSVAYLSTGFGLLRLNLNSGVISETYDNIGPAGAGVAVTASAILNDSLFAATSAGLLAAPLAASVNLLDFRTWALRHSAIDIVDLESNGDALLVNRGGLQLLRYQMGSVEPVSLPVGAIRGLQADGNRFLALIGDGLWEVAATDVVTAVVPEGLFSAQALAVQGGRFWLADACEGLISIENGQRQVFRPDGLLQPFNQRILPLRGGRIAVLPGGYSPETAAALNREGGLSLFEEGSWQHFGATDCPETEGGLPSVTDVTAYMTTPDGTQWLGTFGDGLFRKLPTDTDFTLIADAPFSSFFPSQITDLLYDARTDAVWVTMYADAAGQPAVYRFNATGQWESFTFPVPAAHWAEQLLADDTGLYWLRLRPQAGGGLLVFSEDGSYRLLREGFGNGDLPSSRVNTIVKDLEGSIWVGTDRGVAAFFDPLATLQGNAEAITPIFESSRLLRDERVTAMAVDGGNRKWIGTDNGLWLFSEDGDERDAFFDVGNSPLPGNRIRSLALQPETGEVFVATERGVVAYRGTATQATAEHRQVKVFPNPVPPRYQGLITIEGLAYNATVKITDASGRLVAELQANGGTAVWNGRDYLGNKAKTGVYFVMSIGQEQAFESGDTFVAKFAIIE